MFSKDSVSANDFIFKYTTQNSTAVNGIVKNSAAYAFKGDNASLKFKLKWMDNYLQNAKLNWVGFCFTNARGEGFAAKYVKFQSGTNAGLHMTVRIRPTLRVYMAMRLIMSRWRVRVAPSDFFYANEEAAYVDFSITRTADGIKLGQYDRRQSVVHEPVSPYGRAGCKTRRRVVSERHYPVGWYGHVAGLRTDIGKKIA